MLRTSLILGLVGLPGVVDARESLELRLHARIAERCHIAELSALASGVQTIAVQASCNTEMFVLQLDAPDDLSATVPSAGAATQAGQSFTIRSTRPGAQSIQLSLSRPLAADDVLRVSIRPL